VNKRTIKTQQHQHNDQEIFNWRQLLHCIAYKIYKAPLFGIDQERQQNVNRQ